MKHAVRTRRFNRRSSHRQIMFRNLVTALLKHGRIETTLAKAKELRSLADRMITLGKRGDLHARRQAAAVIQEKPVVKKLFDEIATACKDRAGGYTRVIKLGFRRGDCAPIAIIELVEGPAAKPEPSKTKPKKEKAEAKPAKKKAEAKPAKKKAEAKPKKKKAAAKTTKKKTEAKDEKKKPKKGTKSTKA